MNFFDYSVKPQRKARVVKPQEPFDLRSTTLSRQPTYAGFNIAKPDVGERKTQETGLPLELKGIRSAIDTLEKKIQQLILDANYSKERHDKGHVQLQSFRDSLGELAKARSDPREQFPVVFATGIGDIDLFIVEDGFNFKSDEDAKILSTERVALQFPPLEISGKTWIKCFRLLNTGQPVTRWCAFDGNFQDFTFSI